MTAPSGQGHSEGLADQQPGKGALQSDRAGYGVSREEGVSSPTLLLHCVQGVARRLLLPFDQGASGHFARPGPQQGYHRADKDRLSMGVVEECAYPANQFDTTMTRETLRDELVRELDHLSPEQLKAVYELIDTFKEPTAQAAPNQEAVRDVRDALSDLSEPLSRTIEKEREERI